MNGCALCDGRCCKNFKITVTIFDVIRAEKASGLSAQRFVEFHSPSFLTYDEELILRFSEGEGVLGFKSHPCFFLKGSLCSIYKDAPLCCRLYPFRLDGSISKTACPSLSRIVFRFSPPPPRLAEGLRRELHAYKLMVEEWNAVQGSCEDCLPFLLSRAKEFIKHSAHV